MTINEIAGAQAAASLRGPAPLPVHYPTPPFVIVPGLVNLRDTGGYPIGAKHEPGSTAVRRGVLFRSAELSRVGDEGVAALRELNITHIFDLRSVKEFSKNNTHGHTDRLPTGWDVERVFVPVFLDQDYSPAAIASRFTDYSDGVDVSDPPRCIPYPSGQIRCGKAFPLLSSSETPIPALDEAKTAGERRQVPPQDEAAGHCSSSGVRASSHGKPAEHLDSFGICTALALSYKSSHRPCNGPAVCVHLQRCHTASYLPTLGFSIFGLPFPSSAPFSASCSPLPMANSQWRSRPKDKRQKLIPMTDYV